MNFEILSTDEHSHCDFGTLLKFDTMENAQQAVGIIVNQPYASNKLADGYSGAFRVDTYVMFNVYDERAYFDLIKELQDAAPAYQPEPAGDSPVDHVQDFSGNPEEAIFNLVNSIQNPREATASDKATLLAAAKAFITKHIPGATKIGDTECGDYDFDSYDSDPDLKDWSIERYGKGKWAEVWFYYNGNEFWLEFLVTSKNQEIRLLSVLDDGSDSDYCVVTADNIKFAIDSLDRNYVFNWNAVKIFEILKKLDLDNNCLADAEKIFKKNKKSLNKAAMAYLDDYLPKVRFDECLYDCSGDCDRYGDDCEWIELWFFHKRKNYHIDFVLYDNGTVKLFLCSAKKNYEIIDSVVTTPEDIKEFLKSVDKEGHFAKPEEKIFEILPNATEEVYLSDDNHPEYIEASKAFLNKYLPDATFDCADSNGNGDNAWFNIRFVYDGHKFGLDFTRADSEGGTRSYEIYEIFNDGDYTGEFSVTPETLRETIKKEFFRDEVKKDTEDDTEESPEEPSIETRVTKLENLMDQVQKEIKEIKKNI